MSGGSGRAQESALQQQAMQQQAAFNIALQKAETPDPLTQRLRDYVGKILDYRDGTSGPQDVRNFPDQTAMDLYTSAKQVTDAGRVGKGYGTLSDGANPAFATELDKENDLKRGEFASGMLDQYVNNAITGATGEAASLGAGADATNMAVAGMLNTDYNDAENRYVNYLMRPKQPSFLQQLALGAVRSINPLSFLNSGGGRSGLNRGGLDSINELSV